ncbi:endonuclease/exonuclease/phosphatase family protein [Myxococcus sp. CA051A]|uniref:endonuclease/exonuclease/phosphatase family protein n=1 Tax=Myxococcus sp. CA051A TaxID=2741739 RepID=UPI00157BA70F|nr:endonuclease/exonuclease/phosphatase family protein [Myxococcus sp. CA051A]NTX66292.1 endonuclease/exonuclease/phosphatase family protein [Myxococcus sp. CA051A]
MTPLRFLRLAPLLACAPLCLVACNDDDGDDSVLPGAAQFKVMTRNLYLGGNIELLATAQTPQQIPAIAAQLYTTVQATNFPERAKAIADEIQSTNPALVGLQEVSLYRTQSPSDFASNPVPNAQTVTYDFLAILLAELQSRGLNYRAAATVQNADAEVPAALAGNATDLTDVRLTDRDVILARGDVQIANVVTGNYAYAQEVPVGGASIRFLRGFNKLDATVDGARITFVNTHLETLRPGNENQATELAALVNTYDRPLIVVGDLNTGPGAATTGYPTIVGPGTGLVDAWSTVGTGDGFTCCFSETVNDANTDALDERIDLVLYAGDNVNPQSAVVVGTLIDDRTVSGLWPSDHAGLVVEFRVDD